MQNINYQIKFSSSNVTASAPPKNSINAGDFSLLLGGIQWTQFPPTPREVLLLLLQMWLRKTGCSVGR